MWAESTAHPPQNTINSAASAPARFTALILIGWLLSASTAWAQIDSAKFTVDLSVIAHYPSRIVGSAGYYSAAGYLEAQLAALPNVELKQQQFTVMVPITQSATLSIDAGPTEKVYPFWPAMVRTCSTAPSGIHGRLVYCGRCDYSELKPASLRGQIAVIESSAAANWTAPFDMGAAAELVLGSHDTSWVDLKDHDLRIPVNFPRFYIPPGPLAENLRAGRVPAATLTANIAWQARTATNFFALIRPAAPAQPQRALMFSVPLDSSSLVPDLSPGAGQAVQTAAGIALVRDLSRHPWNRPVIVFFSSGDSIQFLGTRNMFLALGTPPTAWNDESANLEQQSADARRDLARAWQLLDAPQKLSVTGDRPLVDRINQIVDLDVAQAQDRLFRTRAAERLSDANRKIVADLENRQAALERVKFAFQQQPALLDRSDADEFLQRTIARLTDLLRQYADRSAELQQRAHLYHWLADAVGQPRDPLPKRIDARLIELLVGLDLSDGGDFVGPMFFGTFQRAGSFPQIQLYSEWFGKLQRDFAAHHPETAWWATARNSVDLEPLNQIRAQPSYLAGPLPIASELSMVWGTPGFSMITLDDLRLHRDTPADTLSNLPHGRDSAATVRPARSFFPRLERCKIPRPREPAAAGRIAGRAGRQLFLRRARARSSAPGFLATYSYLTNTGAEDRIPPLGLLPWTLGVRRTEVRDCDALGNYRFEGLPRLRSDRMDGPLRDQNDMQVLALSVYRIDPAGGAIVATTDMGKQADTIHWSADIKQDVPPLRSLVFDCQEFSLGGLYDPRFLQTLGQVVPLDAQRNAEPRRFAMWLSDQMLAGFVEPAAATDLLIRFGKIGNRLILLNMSVPSASARSEPRGYLPIELNHLGPLALATTRDFYRLDDQRLADYRRAGVSSPLIDQLHQAAARQLQRADQSLASDDGPGLLRESTGAWANEARVYDAAQDMARDVVRAAIFLLVLCVPFAFCMERLLLAATSVYRQIAGVVGIFLAMTAALWTFHPAFQISASPLIIILAFAIIAMSVLVILVVYGKFDAELKRLSSGRGNVQAASFANAAVFFSAIILGIANMRRRKMRTLLTSVTIVLITFVVLWFTSSTRYLGQTALPLGIASSHPGFLLRQRGFRPMQPIVVDQLRAVLADPALQIDPPRLVQRWWAASAADPREQYDLSAGASRRIGVLAVLGLTPGESSLSQIGQVIGPAKFAALERGRSDVIFLSDAIADQLHAHEADTVRLSGIDLRVAGIFSASEFDGQVNLLSGESLAPLKFASGQLDSGGQQMTETTSQSLDLGGGSAAVEAASAYQHLSSSQFVIVAADVCRMLQNSSLRNVGFRLADQQQVQRVGEELTRRFSLATYAGYDDGVRLIVAANLSGVSGGAQVAIPLLIAGLIIFNTMMGSIAQRRREIHVYTSLGLAPLHVGALFLAEAMTYGLIGTVFGYIIGQGVGTALSHLGWLGSITINYSGTSAIQTMGLILLIVLLSALVPAALASRIAAPSIDRTWKVPAPHNDEIRAELPFTISRSAADGALAYVSEFFQSHREGSIGKFSAAAVEILPFEDSTTHFKSWGLRTTVWLTPYDLGVRQQVTLQIHPGQFPDIYEVDVLLHRLSGDDGSWHRMNRTFLTELRKQFLQWRSLSPPRMLEYVHQSRRLFEPAAS